MVRSSRARRVKASVLLLVLLVGGFGLPIVDGLWFHSKAIARMAPEDRVAGCQDAGRTHLLGCAIWSSPAASTGLPELGVPPAVFAATLAERPLPWVTVVVTQYSTTLALPRAPPSV